MNLFGDEEMKPIKVETCNNCINRQRWQFGGSIIQYCGVRKSNLTRNGLLKIKCKDKACIVFKHKNEK